MRRRLRGLIGVTATTVAIAAIGVVVSYQPAGAGPLHGSHPGAVDEQQARAIEGQIGITGASEFRVTCGSSHRAGNDPIVFPGQTGVSHVHEFFGNRSTNANSTTTSLKAATTNCNPAADLSAYWVPTLYKNGQPVAPESVTVYYQGIHDMQRAVPYPPDMRYVVGNARATSPDQNPSARWSCTTQSPSSRDFMNCPAGTKLETYLDFPQCWNGRDLDSTDHKAHMAYPVAGACPSTHPVPVPKLRMVIRWPVNGSPAGFRLASGNGYSMHGDFFNAWPVAAQAQRVRDCINAIVKCDANGVPIP
jgi:hypothetical protein